MATNLRLSPTSYIVLGLLDQVGEASPYDLKRTIGLTIGNFWSVPHSQLYAEPARLAKAGLLSERRERGGRRRRLYRIAEDGRRALGAWRDEPTDALPELRDLSLLKVFFGGDPKALASAQREAHQAKLEAYRSRSGADTGSGPRGPWRALRAGIRHEEEWVEFWASLEADSRPPSSGDAGGEADRVDEDA